MPIARGYHDLRDRVVAGVDLRFAETVRLVAEDNSWAFEISAVLRTGAQVAQSMVGGRGQAWQVDVAGAAAALHVDRVRHPNLSLNKGDKVQAIERPNAPWFVVHRSYPRGHSRLVVHLIEG